MHEYCLFVFSCRENRTCFNLRWSDGDTKLHYDAGYIYIWDKEASKGNNPDKDIVTTLNVPLMVSSSILNTLKQIKVS